jgi:hypothetical protein
MIISKRRDTPVASAFAKVYPPVAAPEATRASAVAEPMADKTDDRPLSSRDHSDGINHGLADVASLGTQMNTDKGFNKKKAPG